jgi:transcriptional regulator NrdR family protein
MEKNKHKEDICPHCNHDDNSDFEYDIPDVIMSESIAQEVECTVCGTRWTQLYKITYTKTTNVRKPKNEL